MSNSVTIKRKEIKKVLIRPLEDRFPRYVLSSFPEEIRKILEQIVVKWEPDSKWDSIFANVKTEEEYDALTDTVVEYINKSTIELWLSLLKDLNIAHMNFMGFYMFNKKDIKRVTDNKVLLRDGTELLMDEDELISVVGGDDLTIMDDEEDLRLTLVKCAEQDCLYRQMEMKFNFHYFGYQKYVRQ